MHSAHGVCALESSSYAYNVRPKRDYNSIPFLDELILLRILFCICLSVCLYVCMSVTLRNANFLYVACAESTACARSHTIVVSHQYSSMMDQSARWITGLPRMKAIVCRGRSRMTCFPESLRSHRTAPNVMNI